MTDPQSLKEQEAQAAEAAVAYRNSRGPFLLRTPPQPETAVPEPADDSSIAPEIAATQERLDALPGHWVPAEFRREVLARAGAQAARRRLDALLTGARGRAGEARRALIAGDHSEEALIELAQATSVLSAAERMVSEIHVPVQLQTARAALVKADEAVRVMPPAPRVPAWLAERQMWRQMSVQGGGTVDPPQPSDLDRQAEAAWRDATAAHEQHAQTLANWRAEVSNPNSVAEPLDLLGAAASLPDEAARIALLVEASDRIAAEADRHRREAGLTWDPAMAARITQKEAQRA